MCAPSRSSDGTSIASLEGGRSRAGAVGPTTPGPNAPLPAGLIAAAHGEEARVTERTIRMLLAYDGTGFRGWAAQRDPTIRTVQRSLTEAIEPVLGHPVTLAVAGRTDAGVHARGQVASFDTTSERRAGRDPRCDQRPARARGGGDRRAGGVSRLPRPLLGERARVPLPHRRGAGARPVHRGASCGITRSLPIVVAMRRAAAHLVGEHDFTSFCRHPGAGKVHGARSAAHHDPTSRRPPRARLPGERLPASDGAGAHRHARRGGAGHGRPRRGAGHPRGEGPREGAPDGPARAGSPWNGWSTAAGVAEGPDFL